MQPFYKEGRYRAEVVNQGLGKSKTGTPHFALRVKMLSQLVNGEEFDVRDYERTIYVYLNDKTVKYTIEKLERLGFDGSSFRQLDPSDPNACSFVGKLLELDCRHEEYNGEMSEKWDLAYAGSGELNLTPLEPTEVRKLDALFGKSLSNGKPATKPKPATAPVAEAGPITDDDIPF